MEYMISGVYCFDLGLLECNETKEEKRIEKTQHLKTLKKNSNKRYRDKQKKRLFAKP